MSLHTDTLQTSMDTFLKKHSTSIFRKPPEDTNSKFLWNTATHITCYRNLDHIMLYMYHSNKLKANYNLMFSRGHTIVTSRELMWCYACSWDVRGDLTLNYMAQIHTSVTVLPHVISRGALVGSRASSPHTFLLLHTFREAWPTCRVFLLVFMTVIIVRRDAECS